MADGGRGGRRERSNQHFPESQVPWVRALFSEKDRRRFFSYHFGWLPYFAFRSFRRVSLSYLFGNYDEE